MLNEVGSPTGENASVHQFHLGQGEALFVETAGAGGLDGQLASGAVRVASDSPVGVSGIFTIRGPQGQFLTETGIAASPLRSEATVVVENAGAASTGLAVFNPSPENVTLTLSLFDPQGQAPASGAGEGPSAEPGTRTLELPAGGRIAAFISELFPGLPMARGSMTIRGPAATLTLRQNLSPLSFTAMPVLGAASSGLPPAQ